MNPGLWFEDVKPSKNVLKFVKIAKAVQHLKLDPQRKRIDINASSMDMMRFKLPIVPV